jgi:hypothetical protein
MMRRRMGADMTRNKSAAFSKTSSDSVRTLSSGGADLAILSFHQMSQMPHDFPAKGNK